MSSDDQRSSPKRGEREEGTTHELGDSVGRSRVEGSSLGLRSLNDLSVELRGGSLVESDVLLESSGSDSVEDSEGSESVDVPSVLGHLEGNLDVRLSSQVVDLSGLGERRRKRRESKGISLSSNVEVNGRRWM